MWSVCGLYVRNLSQLIFTIQTSITYFQNVCFFPGGGQINRKALTDSHVLKILDLPSAIRHVSAGVRCTVMVECGGAVFICGVLALDGKSGVTALTNSCALRMLEFVASNPDI